LVRFWYIDTKCTGCAATAGSRDSLEVLMALKIYAQYSF